MNLSHAFLFAKLSPALFLGALFAASCGGNVIVDTPPEECESDETVCGGNCVNLSVDEQNCGACGNVCDEGGYCAAGSCLESPDCPPSTTPCDGTCVDPNNDASNCGGCGNVCPPGAVCSGGGCQIGECFCGSLCNVISLGSTVPQVAITSTDLLVEQWVPTCAAQSGPDAVFSYFAPQEGQYVFSVEGSSMPAAIEVLDPACFSYGCSESFGGSPIASVGVYLFAGQQVLAVVESKGLSGTIQLNINGSPVDCATCEQVITTGDVGFGFCPGSEELYDSLVNCICIGDCAPSCEEACQGGDFTMDCESCIYDTVMGCGVQLNDCLNDF